MTLACGRSGPAFIWTVFDAAHDLSDARIYQVRPQPGNQLPFPLIATLGMSFGFARGHSTNPAREAGLYRVYG
jgi:hypothetical protein